MQNNGIFNNGPDSFVGNLRGENPSGIFAGAQKQAPQVEKQAQPEEDEFIVKLREAVKTPEGKKAFNKAFGSYLDTVATEEEKRRNPSAFTKGFIESLREAYNTRSNEAKTEDVEEVGPKAEDEYDESDYVTYTYKPGDTFGNVLLKTGLATDKGLWGSDGDVAFYNKQLVDTKLNPSLGGRLTNIPVGTKIKLLKRGATPKNKK